MFSHKKVRPSSDVGNFGDGSGLPSFYLGRVPHAKVELGRADCIGMAASMLLIAVVDAVVL